MITKSILATCSTALAALLAPGAAFAQAMPENDQWWVRAGPAWVAFDETVKLSMGGATVPGAGAKVKDNLAAVAEIGYRLTPNLSLGLTVGIPARTRLTANGTASAVGTIGRVKYGPAGLTLQYQFNQPGRLRPYLGVGVTYLKVFDTSDGAVANFQAENAWGPLLQAGTEYRINDKVGLFVDLKKMGLRTDSTGTLGGVPVHADVRLNPLVVHAGAMVRF